MARSSFVEIRGPVEGEEGAEDLLLRDAGRGEMSSKTVGAMK
jgi:hypothetical protein